MSIRHEFETRGFVSPIDVLDPVQTAQARQMLDELEATVDPKVRSVGLLGKHLTHEGIWSLATHPRLLDAVAEAIGEDLLLLGTHFFVKYPGQVEAYVAWHQDVTYWGLQPPLAVSAWLAIDDAAVDNGAMRVIPGTHKRGQLPHGEAAKSGNLLSVNQSIDDAIVDDSGAVDVVLKAGQMSLHDGLLIHGSNPNKSNRRRAGLTVRFTRSDVSLVGDSKQVHGWKPILVRGKALRSQPLAPPPFELVARKAELRTGDPPHRKAL